MQIGQNVIAYATNRVLKEKLDRPNVAVERRGSGTGVAWRAGDPQTAAWWWQ